jgi:hypothetical protein
MKKFLRIIIIIIGIASLVMASGVFDGHLNLAIFRMFTNISNFLCVIYLLFFHKNDFLMGICLTSITITFIIAAFILKMSFGFDSFLNASFLGLHYLVPILFNIYFIISEKKHFKKYYPLLWLIYPFIYLVFCLITKFYPYPFIDISHLGIFKVLINSILVSMAFMGLGYLYYFINLKLKK